MNSDRLRTRLTLIILFGTAMGWFEAAIVVYLRELFYPAGFSFPLTIIPWHILIVELTREAASLLMLVAVAGLAGRTFWERFAYFMVTFGLWDISYYLFLKATLGWPASLLDWDILFLIPLPWIAPVIAPVLIAVVMIVCGLVMINLSARGCVLKPALSVWILTSAGTVAILYSFMKDTAAGLHQQMPQPYSYWLLAVGLVLYAAALVLFYRRAKNRAPS